MDVRHVFFPHKIEFPCEQAIMRPHSKAQPKYAKKSWFLGSHTFQDPLAGAVFQLLYYESSESIGIPSRAGCKSIRVTL